MPRRDAPDEAHRLTDAELAKLERRIQKVYGKARDDLTATVNAYFEAFKKRDEEMRQEIGKTHNGKVWTEKDYRLWRMNQIARGKRFEALRDKMAERYTHANEVAISYVNDATPGIYSLNRNYAAYTIDKATGGALTIGTDGETLNADFTLFDERTVKRLIVDAPDVMPYYPPERAIRRGIDLQYGKSQITKTVTSGALRGLGVGKIADELQERVETMNRTSALRAARTGITAAQNAGRMDSYHAAEKMGIHLKKQWLATLDGRTRHEHRRLDGQVRETEKPFEVEGEKIMYPGDPDAAPHLVYNCRCTLIAALQDVEISAGKRRAKGETADAEDKSYAVIENLTYDEWEGKIKQKERARLASVLKSALEQKQTKKEPTIAGVERGKPMSHNEADTGHVNPHFKEGGGYTINCQSCVVTYDARLRGYDVEVVPNNDDHPMCKKLAEDERLAYKNKDGSSAQLLIGDNTWRREDIWEGDKPTAKRFEKKLLETLDSNGRYTMSFKWRGFNAGHIVCIEKDIDMLVIYDPQSDRTFYGKSVSEYLDRLQYKRQYKGKTFYQWPNVMRVDDKDFDFAVVNEIMIKAVKK